ncbi:MAG: hypothetical protein ABUT20_35580 [Bacteroidota bacterium]
MKKVLSFHVFMILMSSVFLVNCSKSSSSSSSLTTSPEALAAHDSKSGGVYKGVLIGSSGTVKVVLQGGVLQIIMKIDGETRTLTTTSLSSWTSGDDITDAVFTNGTWSVSFSVNANGGSADIIPNIPGHSGMEIEIEKEKSNEMVKVYEGTYAGTGITSPNNKWNFLIHNTDVSGIYSNGSSIEHLSGAVSGNNVGGATFSGATFTGTISGNSVSGTWTDSPDNGTWTGTRTL